MTILYFDERFLEHETGKHPESPERLRAIGTELTRSGLRDRCRAGETRLATVEELISIHDGKYRERLEKFASMGGGWIEQDTFVSPNSYAAASRAAGTCISAVDQVMASVDKNALCLVRPPGHHALAHDAMGFCLFNNVAIAAQRAIVTHRLERVLVVDWDVHHGNGTQDIFYERQDVWFLSAHRFPFYPGTGKKNETGTGKGLGTKFNLPVAFGTTRKDYLTQFESVFQDCIEKCRPQLILISAGFDAHADDPIGSLGLQTEDFETLSRLVIDAAKTHCQGRIVSCLEGGYNVTRLAESVGCHLKELLKASE
ncbi:MAG: histone deacetylase [Planctomycetes bacterium]|nr:histone deacetylase [Planctomycetota bacterium]